MTDRPKLHTHLYLAFAIVQTSSAASLKAHCLQSNRLPAQLSSVHGQWKKRDYEEEVKIVKFEKLGRTKPPDLTLWKN